MSKIEENKKALLRGMRVPGGLILGFFRIGSAASLELDSWDGYSQKDIEQMQRDYWGGRWGKPRPDLKKRSIIR